MILLETEERLVDANYLQEAAICGGDKDRGFIPIKKLWNAPTIDAKRIVRGRWIEQNGVRGCGQSFNTCSECKQWFPCGCLVGNFCPNCGADMREVEDDKQFFI